VTEVMLKFDTKHPFEEVGPSTKLRDLKPFFDKYAFAFVSTPDSEGKPIVSKVVTKIDLLQYFLRK